MIPPTPATMPCRTCGLFVTKSCQALDVGVLMRLSLLQSWGIFSSSHFKTIARGSEVQHTSCIYRKASPSALMNASLE